MFITLHGETRYGDTVNVDTGAIIPVNTAELIPKAAGSETALTAVKFTQALSENFVTFAGKLNMFDEFKMPFTGDRLFDGFWNLGMSFPVVVARTIPYSTLGAGAAILKDGVPVFTVMVLDTNNTPTTSGFDTFFRQRSDDLREPHVADEVLRPAGFTRGLGHFQYRQLQQFVANGLLRSRARTRHYAGIRSRLVVRLLLGHAGAVGRSVQSRSVCTASSRTSAPPTTDPARSASAPTWRSTAAARSPIVRSIRSASVTRITQYSSPVQDFAPVLLPIGNDQAIELFYNFAVTPWFNVAPDLQVVFPARDETLPPNRQSIDTALVLGIRAKLNF